VQKTTEERIVQKESFEFRVKLMRGQVEEKNQYIAVPSGGGAEGCRSCLAREFRSAGAWWVKDLSVTLKRERTKGR